MNFLLFFFFFSSRRRHTRLVSDWSSDVCSSDLFVVVLSRDEQPRQGDAFRLSRRVGHVARVRRTLEVEDSRLELVPHQMQPHFPEVRIDDSLRSTRLSRQPRRLPGELEGTLCVAPCPLHPREGHLAPRQYLQLSRPLDQFRTQCQLTLRAI